MFLSRWPARKYTINIERERYTVMKRIFCVLFAAMMLLSLLPVTASAGAEATYSVWVEGVQITESNATDVLGAADGDAKTVAFDPKTNTLTLKNATLGAEGTASGRGYVRAVESKLDSLTVLLIGNNLIGKAVTSESAFEEYSIDYGFLCTGDIAFTGDADCSLTIYDYYAGIRAKNVTFGESFKGKLTVRDSGGPEPQPPCAINAFGVVVEETGDYVSDGTIRLLGGTFDIESFLSNGIVADGSVTIKNAKLSSVAADEAIHSEYCGITITDSEVTVVGDTAINTYEGDVLIENSNIKVTSTVCEGIDGRDISLINCGKVEIISTEDSIYSGRKVSIINCPDVVLDCNELTAIYGRDILIDNSTVDAIARDGSGIRADYNEEFEGDGSVTVKDSIVTVRAKRDGISCSSLSVVGGKTYIYAAGDTDSDGNGRGAYIEGDESAISVSGSTVLLTGGEAALKFEKSSETNPYSGTLPNASFKGNTAYDTFTSMADVNYKSQKVSDMADQFFECAYVGDVLAKSVSVMHVHKLVKVDEVPATTEKSGVKSHYVCDCGKFFEDANGEKEIADFEKWKAEGGNGYLPKLEKEPTSPKTDDTGDETLWIMLMGVAIAGLAFCGVISRKSRSAE